MRGGGGDIAKTRKSDDLPQTPVWLAGGMIAMLCETCRPRGEVESFVFTQYDVATFAAQARDARRAKARSRNENNLKARFSYFFKITQDVFIDFVVLIKVSKKAKIYVVHDVLQYI